MEISLFAIVADPASVMAQSPAMPDPVARAVAVQFSVAPESAPCAVPDTWSVVKQVAVNVPEADEADCSVTFHRKFVHDVSSEVALAVVELHCPPRKLTVWVGLVGGFVRNSKQPALSTEDTRATAKNVLVMVEALPRVPAAGAFGVRVVSL